jgi:hypothetical protein
MAYSSEIAIACWLLRWRPLCLIRVLPDEEAARISNAVQPCGVDECDDDYRCGARITAFAHQASAHTEVWCIPAPDGGCYVEGLLSGGFKTIHVCPRIS